MRLTPSTRFHSRLAAIFNFTTLIAIITLFCAPSTPLIADTQGDWCGPNTRYMQTYGSRYAKLLADCPIEGPCDNPEMRNTYIPQGGDSITWLKIMIHVFRNSDGTAASASPATVVSQMKELNKDYLPAKIQFSYDWRFVDDTRYRSMSEDEFFPMKNLYAIDPQRQINVFVGYVEASYSYGTFPWDPDCLTNQGGIVMTTPHFVADESTLAHEVGHCLGLWHTFHGVSEVAPGCAGCRELSNGFETDLTGDFCADTRPTPLNNFCTELTGTDLCSGTPWAPTPLNNFMGYSGSSCWDRFSEQQKGRMHCWLNSGLATWRCSAGADSDGDVISDLCDNCLDTPNNDQADIDFDVIGDACDPCVDSDFDGVGDSGFVSFGCPTGDNCRFVANADQLDTDDDAIGDACDNCPNDSNPNQRDKNNDGIGDMCDGNLHIVSYSLPEGKLNIPYSHSLQAINGVQPYNWVLLGGDLPFGCNFTGGAVGTISGTPTWAADYYMTFTLQDSGNPAQYDTISLSIAVIEPPYYCGDANKSGEVDIADALSIINYIFASGVAPNPIESGDTDCSNTVDISDVVVLINYTFAGGAQPCAACP